MANNLTDWFKKNKTSYIKISVHVKNKVGESFWRKIGFKDFMRSMNLKI